jgi:CRP-like cAMP-binding protein
MATALVFSDHAQCSALTTLVTGSAPDPAGARRRTLKRRDSIWLSEAPFDRVYRLETGHISIVGVDEAGRELQLRSIAAGEWFGDYCLCPGQEWIHPALAARADEDCRLTEVSHSRWLRSLTADAAAVRAFVTQSCLRLANADRRLVILARRSSDERIGLLLLEHATIEPASWTSGIGQVALTHAEIATAAAMTRPHVSVTLGRFRRQGLIAYRRHEAITVNVTKLRAYLDRFTGND